MLSSKHKFYYKGRMFRTFRQLREYYFQETSSMPTYFVKVPACNGGTILSYR